MVPLIVERLIMLKEKFNRYFP